MSNKVWQMMGMAVLLGMGVASTPGHAAEGALTPAFLAGGKWGNDAHCSRSYLTFQVDAEGGVTRTYCALINGKREDTRCEEGQKVKLSAGTGSKELVMEYNKRTIHLSMVDDDTLQQVKAGMFGTMSKPETLKRCAE